MSNSIDPQVSSLFNCGGAYARSGDWRQHGDVHFAKVSYSSVPPVTHTLSRPRTYSTATTAAAPPASFLAVQGELRSLLKSQLPTVRSQFCLYLLVMAGANAPNRSRAVRFSRPSRPPLPIIFRAILASWEQCKPAPRLASCPQIIECGLGGCSLKPVKGEER